MNIFKYINSHIHKFVEQIQNNHILKQAKGDVDIHIEICCETCDYCSRKKRYCKNKKLFKNSISIEQYELYQLTRPDHRLYLDTAIKRCQLNNWSHRLELIKFINNNFYIYDQNDNGQYQWRRCVFFHNGEKLENEYVFEKYFTEEFDN